MGNPRTLAQFPQEFHDVWLLAIAGKLRLVLPTKGMAVNMKQRLYSFRKKLAEEQGPMAAAPHYQVDLQVQQLENGETLLFACETDWKQQVRKAAAQLTTQLGVPPVEAPEQPQQEPQDDATDAAVQQLLQKL